MTLQVSAGHGQPVFHAFLHDITGRRLAQQQLRRTRHAVADTGIGIPAEQYARLFTRFFRADTATSRGIKGTGLGLTIAKAIVEAHRGTIAAGPAPGGGTTFTLTLPADTA